MMLNMCELERLEVSSSNFAQRASLLGKNGLPAKKLVTNVGIPSMLGKYVKHFHKKHCWKANEYCWFKETVILKRSLQSQLKEGGIK